MLGLEGTNDFFDCSTDVSKLRRGECFGRRISYFNDLAGSEVDVNASVCSVKEVVGWERQPVQQNGETGQVWHGTLDNALKCRWLEFSLGRHLPPGHSALISYALQFGHEASVVEYCSHRPTIHGHPWLPGSRYRV